MIPQLLIVGHIVRDLTATGWVAGGGALYAAAQAQKLGLDTAVVTACDALIDPEKLVPGVQWRILPLDESICFENTYQDRLRTQRVHPVDHPIRQQDIPEEWLDAPIVFLTPVFHDVDADLPRALARPGRLLGLGAQGWLRQQKAGVVTARSVEPAPAWLRGDVVFLSEQDVVDPEAVASWQLTVPTILLTRGRTGYTVWDQHGRHELTPAPACEHDPTGAGDVFATAFLVRYSETCDALTSARFAAAAAAHSVEGAGIAALGDRAVIEARLRQIGATA